MKYYQFFYYIGSKERYLDKIYNLFIEHDVFIDVFGGSGVVALNHPADNVIKIYNDLDKEIVNLFAVLKDKEKNRALFDKFELEICHYDVFMEAEKIKENPEKYSDIDRAWSFLYTIYFSWRGNRENFMLDFNRLTTNKMNKIRSNINEAYKVVKKLQSIQYHSMDYKELLNKVSKKKDRRILMFLDPPYFNKRVSYHADREDSFSTNMDSHYELVNILLEYPKDKTHYFIYTSYMNDANKELLNHGWKAIKYTLNSNLTGGETLEKKEDYIFISPNLVNELKNKQGILHLE